MMTTYPDCTDPRYRLRLVPRGDYFTIEVGTDRNNQRVHLSFEEARKLAIELFAFAGEAK